MKLLPPLQAPGPLASLLGANLPSSPGQSRERSINAQRPCQQGAAGPFGRCSIGSPAAPAFFPLPRSGTCTSPGRSSNERRTGRTVTALLRRSAREGR